MEAREINKLLERLDRLSMALEDQDFGSRDVKTIYDAMDLIKDLSNQVLDLNGGSRADHN